MSVAFFISNDGSTKVCLDSTKSVNVNSPSTASQSSTLNGKGTSHTVVEGNTTISISGIVTYSKMLNQQDNLNPINLQEQLQISRRNRHKFTLYMKSDDYPLLRDYEDCTIVDVSVTAEDLANAIQVSIMFEQVFVPEIATVTTIAIAPTDSAKTEGNSTPSDTGRGGKTAVEEGERATMFQKTGAWASGDTDFSLFGD